MIAIIAVTTPAVRRVLSGVFATCLVGGAAMAIPSATAANDPCAASEIARTIGSVATNTGNYLDAHPETNSALTAAAAQPGPQALAALKTYFDSNAQASKDLQGLQQPLQSLSGRCKLPITLPQILQFMQAAQNGQGVGAVSPGTLNAGAPVAGSGVGCRRPAAPDERFSATRLPLGNNLRTNSA
ncbi:MAG: hemophore [Mycobacteriaceae bacterium]|nr:hemophore [Mycobacteriaceae bacterium]